MSRHLTILTRTYRLELLPRAAYEVEFVAATASIGLTLESQTGQHALGTDRHGEFYTPVNTVSYLPKGCDVYSRSESGGEYLKLTPRTEGASFDVAKQVRNHRATAKTIALTREFRKLCLNTQGVVPAEYLEQLMLDWLTSLEGYETPQQGASFTKAQLKRLEDYIWAHLAEPLDVTTLAKFMGLSAGYFSRQFKNMVGLSPYDFVLDVRLSRAREYIKSDRMDLTEIALETGFSSHAHMSNCFKRRLGISPKALR